MNWAANAALTLSVIGNFLVTLRLAVFRPGPRNEPEEQLPNWPLVVPVRAAGFRSVLPMLLPIWTVCIAWLPETPCTQFGRGWYDPVSDDAESEF